MPQLILKAINEIENKYNTCNKQADHTINPANG